MDLQKDCGIGAEGEKIVHRIIGAAIEVHRTLGPGYSEAIYEEALIKELSLRQLRFERQKSFDIYYKNERIGTGRIDLLVEDRIVLELKAVENILPVHSAQLYAYLKALNLPLGLLLNFAVPVMQHGIKRVILKGVKK